MSLNQSMQSPGNLTGQTVTARSGNQYTSGTNGIIANVSPGDINDLEQMGCNTLSNLGQSNGAISMDGTLYAASYTATAQNPSVAGTLGSSATGTDVVLGVYSLPANAFDGLGLGERGVSVTVIGQVAGNANAKRSKIWWGTTGAVVGAAWPGATGTVVADTGATLNTDSGVGFRLGADVFHIGAAGANTQVAAASSQSTGSRSNGVGTPVFPTSTENATIQIAVTANCTTTATDIDLNLFRVVGIN